MRADLRSPAQNFLLQRILRVIARRGVTARPSSGGLAWPWMARTKMPKGRKRPAEADQDRTDETDPSGARAPVRTPPPSLCAERARPTLTARRHLRAGGGRGGFRLGCGIETTGGAQLPAQLPAPPPRFACAQNASLTVLCDRRCRSTTTLDVPAILNLTTSRMIGCASA